MNHFLKKIFTVLTLATITLTNISANKSNWVGMELSSDEINNCIHFQVLRGGTCISEFEKLKPVLDRFIAKKIDAAYLKNILGKPNNTIVAKNQARFQYYLTSNLNIYQVNLTTRDNNLVSYKIENSL